MAFLELRSAVVAGLEQAGVGNVSEIFTGASTCAFMFEANDDMAAEQVAEEVRARLRTAPNPGDPPLSCLSFVVDVAKGDAGKALDIATARNRTRQFREFTVDLPDPDKPSVSPDFFDRTRAATGTVRVPKGKIHLLNDNEASGEVADEVPVSDSVRLRRAYGRRMRQRFYAERGCPEAKGLAFADSLGDMVADPPTGIPLSLGSKIALVYVDGNRFGSIRRQMRAQDFARDLEAKHRQLLRAIITWFSGAADRNDDRLVVEDDRGRSGLRFETLLWGGDELMLAMPSWLLFSFLEGFFESTANWKIGAHRLTHALGVAVCHHKTPVRQAQAIARDLAQTVKDATAPDEPAANGVAFEIFESLAPPDDSLRDARSRLFGLGDDAGTSDQLARHLVLPGDDFQTVLARMRGIKDTDGLPRSQIYSALRTIRAQGRGFLDHEASKLAADHVREYLRRVRDEADRALQGLRLPAFGPTARSFAVELVLMATLWDYVDPFEQPLAPFAFPGGAREPPRNL